MIAALSRGLGAVRGGRVALAATALGVALLLAAPGDLARGAARAAVVVLALGAGAIVIARRGAKAPAAPSLAIVAQAPLGRGASVAIVESGGRRLLVGFGEQGVRLVAELDRAADEGQRP